MRYRRLSSSLPVSHGYSSLLLPGAPHVDTTTCPHHYPCVPPYCSRDCAPRLIDQGQGPLGRAIKMVSTSKELQRVEKLAGLSPGLRREGAHEARHMTSCIASRLCMHMLILKHG
jgi:hypothetical protein